MPYMQKKLPGGLQLSRPIPSHVLSFVFSTVLSNSAYRNTLSFSLFRLLGNASEDAVLTPSISSLLQPTSM